MGMSRKHYVELANELGYARRQVFGARDPVTDKQWDVTLAAVCRFFQNDNPDFNPDTFRQAVDYAATTGHPVKVGQKNFDHNPFKCKEYPCADVRQRVIDQGKKERRADATR